MSVTTFDCETEEGRKYIESEAIAADRIGKAKNYHPFIFGTGSRVDRLFYDDDAIVRVLCEIRSRNKSLDDFRQYKSVLCNRKKLDDGAEAAKIFNVPFYLFIRTLIDDQIIFCEIADKNGVITVPFETHTRSIQKTCNGGIAKREIAYIGIEHWSKLRE
tara:strand:+ start:5077 stop:5556 length:480 start_codon:yes stop_codon:yes gene_type:complete